MEYPRPLTHLQMTTQIYQRKHIQNQDFLQHGEQVASWDKDNICHLPRLQRLERLCSVPEENPCHGIFGPYECSKPHLWQECELFSHGLHSSLPAQMILPGNEFKI